MPLASAIEEIPFATGLAQKTDPRHVQSGALTTLINCSADKAGALRKRYGSTAVSKQSLTAAGASIALTSGAAVEAYQGNALVSDGSNLFAYSGTKKALIYKDQLPECIATRASIAHGASDVQSVDMAATNGYTAYVYRAADVAGSVKNYAIVLDQATGALIGPATLDTTPNAGLRVVASGNVFYAIWTDSAGKLVYSSFDTAGTFLWSVTLTLTNDMSATATAGAWDVSAVDGNSNFVIVYQRSGTPNDCAVRMFNSSGSNIATGSFAIASGVYPVKAFAIRSTTSETCWVAYALGDGATTDYVRVIGFNPSTLATTVADAQLWTEAIASTTRRIGVGRVSSTTCVVASSNTATNPDVSWRMKDNTASPPIGPTRTQKGYTLWSKPAAIGSSVYCMFYRYGDPVNQTFQFVDLIVSDTASDSAKARPVATIAPRLASTIGTMAICPSVVSIGNGQYGTLVSVQESTSSVGVHAATLDFSTPLRHQAVELGPCAYVAGGVPSVFDGSQVSEHGFLNAPILGNTATSAGGAVDVGQHQYAIVFTQVNGRGERARSAPVFSGTVTTTGGNQTVTIQVNPYNMTTRQDAANSWSPAVTFDLYRNTIADPATFWKVTADSALTASDPRTSGVVTLTDTIADSTLTANAYGVLYSLGGVLTEECPSSLTCLCTHKSRLWGVGDDGFTLWFTKQYVPGFTPGFNDELTLTVPEDGGAVTGLASLDDSLVVFKRDRIFRLYGTGPNNTGNQSDFSSFIATASDTGCTSQRSIVVAQAGVYFMSPKGLCLLTRAGEVVYAGRAVEDIVRANPVCFASDIVAPLEEIRWCLAPTSSSATGVVVTFNYGTDVWSVSQYWDSDQAVASAVVKGARAPGGNWHWLGAGGQLSVESSSTYLDAGTWVTMQVATAWVKANGILGWGRFRELSALAEQVSPFQCTIDWGEDYSDTWQAGDTWSDATIATFSDPVFALSVQPADQRTPAMRMRYTDAAPVSNPVGTGQGAVLVGASVECGVLRVGAGKRQPSSQAA